MFTDTDKQQFDAMIKCLLEKNGISRNSCSFRDYGKAIKLLPKMANYKYNRALVIIRKWISV